MPKAGRIQAIDLARGIAVVLMILSHGVKGLLSFEQIPIWGLVPIHLITKFSSSLFIIVFGVSLAVAALPYVDSSSWRERRQKLLVRGLLVFFWYKVLTIVEMTPMYDRNDIIDTLLYKEFPVYVEILGFYALALLWVPFVLQLWKRTPFAIQCAVPVAFAFLAHALYQHFDFWGLASLQAIFVEHEDHYTWGQISRAPLIFGGLILGGLVISAYGEVKTRLYFSFALVAVGLVMLAGVVALEEPTLLDGLVAIAKNEGKHPPELSFMLFSIGGALTTLGLTFAGGERLAQILHPITVIGSKALRSFVFHIFVIFVFYRYLFNFFHNVPYVQALALTVLLIGMTALWVKLSDWVKKLT